MRYLFFFTFVFFLLAIFSLTLRHFWAKNKRSSFTARAVPLLILIVVITPQLLYRLDSGINIPREAFFTAYFLMSIGSLWIIYSLFTFEIPSFFRFLQRKNQKKRGHGEQGPVSPKRRELVRKSFAFGGASAALTTAAMGANSCELIEITRPRLLFSRLPSEWSGLKILQISDLHVGPLINRDECERVVALALSERPDIIVLTGDMLDGKVKKLRADMMPLKKLKAPLGVFFIPGNHEYYWGGEEWMNFFSKELGHKVLKNSGELIFPKLASGRPLYICGVTDKTAGRFKSEGPDLEKALKDAPEDSFRILLAHRPRFADIAKNYPVDLQLSGHTHGGQFFPFNFIVSLVQPYLAGTYTLKKLKLYVNRGTGYWGPPNRLGVPREITVLELVSLK